MTEAVKHNILQKGFLIRAVEKRLLKLFQEGKINGTVHTCIGQELIGATAAEFLNENDYVLSNHRGHGHYLARNTDLLPFFAEIMGRQDGMCGGIGGSQHFCTTNHLSNGIQGGMTPIGTGIALANKLQNNNNIVMCFIGDGTLGEGVIYEAFNLASLWDLAVVFVLENNGIAQSTPHKQTFSGSIQDRAKGFGLEYYSSSTLNLDHLYSTLNKATTACRNNNKAILVEIETYRLGSHSKGDDNRYEEEIKNYKTKDLLHNEYLKHKLEFELVLENIQKKIDLAVNKALQSPFTKIPSYKALIANIEVSYTAQQSGPNTKRINQLIYDALKSQFQKDSNTILIGEDIQYLTPWTEKPYGGAFKVTGDLSQVFKNVKNTPISEAAIVGVGSGLALKGMQPIVEIMFGDFMTLTFDQIYNHACKFSLMFNKQVSVPLIIRTPMGGKRGYGPTHSQSIEKHFLGITNLSIVALNDRVLPSNIYKEVFNESNPTLVLENKVLYTKKLRHDIFAGFIFELSDEKYPTIRIRPDEKTADITLLCYGELLEDVEAAVELAFYEEEIFCEVICPSRISPINCNPIFKSIATTNRLLIIEEGTNVAAYSSEVSAQIMEHNIVLKAFGRLANNNIIPSSIECEKQILPNKNSIFKKIIETYHGK